MKHLYRKLFTILLTAIYLFSAITPTYAAAQYLYDANGNMTSDGQKCYEYNDYNQLSKVKKCSNSQVIAEYIYDYQGNRIVKKEYENGQLKKTVYSPSDEYETVKKANGTTENTTYYFANGQLLAKKNPDGNKNYSHNDHLGSASVLTDQTGQKIEETQYDPWGEVKTGGTKTKFQYTGQEKDLDTGLNYYNARYYDSHIRRFTQPDDILPDIYDPQQLNRYSYVRNNPLRYTDPTGHCLGPLVIVCAAALIAAPVVIPFLAANIVPISMMLSQAGTDIQKNPSPANIALTVLDVGSNFIPGGKTGGTVVKTAGKIASNAPEAKTVINTVKETVKQTVHGNDLRNKAQTIGYTLRDMGTGAIKKIGETMHPEKRYSQTWLDKNNLEMVQEVTGTKHEMRIWEHEKLGEYLMDFLELPQYNKVLR